jgi:hypothetical protein
LLADADSSERLRRALVGDRAYGLAAMEEMTGGARLLKPMAELDMARVTAQQPLMPQAATQPTWPAAQAILARQPVPAVRPRPKPRRSGHRAPVDFAHVLSNDNAGGAGLRLIQIEMRQRAERRMAAVSLAAQLYRADHGGAWPASLQALVPQYLPAVPQDPFAADGRPLGYAVLTNNRPDGADRPLVYDVSDDGTDQLTTNPGWVGAAPNYGWLQSAPDQWRDLSRWAPPPATQPVQPSPEAGGEENEKPNQPGKPAER